MVMQSRVGRSPIVFKDGKRWIALPDNFITEGDEVHVIQGGFGEISVDMIYGLTHVPGWDGVPDDLSGHIDPKTIDPKDWE